jgi:hypothetical protein
MIHLNSQGVLKQGRNSQALDFFLPHDLFLRTCLRGSKKRKKIIERNTSPTLQPTGLDVPVLLFLSDGRCLLVNPELKTQKKRDCPPCGTDHTEQGAGRSWETLINQFEMFERKESSVARELQEDTFKKNQNCPSLGAL